MEIAGVVAAVVVIVVVGLWAYRRGKTKGAAEVTDIVRRANKLKQMAETRRFYTPESPDPNPDLEYCNAFQKDGTTRYDLKIFDSGGLQSTRAELTGDELQRFLKDGGWQLIAQNFSSQAGGMTPQFMRRKAG